MQHNPKLSCKNIWKLYGSGSNDHLKTPEQQDKANLNTDETASLIRNTSGIVAAANVSFEVFPGEIFVIMGLSGSGKSTVVRCLSRLVDATCGQIWLDDTNLLTIPDKDLIHLRRHKMGMVFQSFGLMPHLSVLENVAFPLKLQGMTQKKRLERAHEMIERVGLSGREAAFPANLSGGQQQRVGIARSLAVEPEIWFLDEPFSALDPLIRRQMQDEFLRLQSELHKSIVFITHDFQEALRIADRMAIMKDGQIVQVGKPVDLILKPATDYVKEFTKDVPWDRVLTASDICSQEAVPAGAKQIQGQTLVADLLLDLAENEQGLDVQGHGLLRPQDVVRSLANAGQQAAS